jgi:superfamily II DNA/RNA helicase
MAAYLRSGKILTIFHSHKNLNKLFSSVSWRAFNEMPLEARLVRRLNDLKITTLTEIQQKVAKLNTHQPTELFICSINITPK